MIDCWNGRNPKLHQCDVLWWSQGPAATTSPRQANKQEFSIFLTNKKIQQIWPRISHLDTPSWGLLHRLTLWTGGFNVMILNNGEFNGWREKTALRIDCGRRLKWVFHASRVRAMRSFSCLGELSLSPFLSSPILRNRNTSPRTVYYRSWRKLLKTTSLYLPAQH